jgi:hypothetical protein
MVAVVVWLAADMQISCKIKLSEKCHKAHMPPQKKRYQED